MAENEQKTPKKFRVRFKKDPGSNDMIEPGEIFIEERSLGTRLLKSNFSNEKSISYGEIAEHTIDTKNDNLNNYFSKNVLNNGLTVVDVNGQLLSVGIDTTKTTEINLDDYIQGGIYLFNISNFVLKETFNGGSLQNTSLPIQRGYLIVIEGLSSGDIRQIFIDNYGIQHNTTSERMFIRGKASGNWSAWKEILNSDFGKQSPTEKLKESKSKNKNGNPDINYFRDFGVYCFNTKEEHYAENKPVWYVDSQGNQILTYERELLYLEKDEKGNLKKDKDGNIPYFMRNQNGILTTIPIGESGVKQYWSGFGGEGDLTFVRSLIIDNGKENWNEWTLLNNSRPLHIKIALDNKYNDLTSVDFDKILKPGLYWISAKDKIANGPASLVNCFLQVLSYGDFTRQIAIRGGSFGTTGSVSNTADEIWSRPIISGVTGTWGKVQLTTG